MKIAGSVVLGVVGGALAGFALSEIVALLGLLLVERPVGLRYLPVALAVAGGLAAAAVTSRRRRDREATR
jgi:Family of unknown function (DUF5957)